MCAADLPTLAEQGGTSLDAARIARLYAELGVPLQRVMQILLHASPPLIYRAIKMNVRLCRWERALELAQQHSKHVDTVLWYRQKFLRAHKRKETLSKFEKAAASVEINEEEIKARKAREKSDEMARFGGGGGGGGGDHK